MMKADFRTKFWAFLIAFLMLITTFPLTALAEGEAQEPADTSQPVETTQPEDSPQPVDSPQPEDSQQPVDSRSRRKRRCFQASR